MTDPFSQAFAAAGARGAPAVVLAFGAGVASSLGPCVAPRFLAAAGLACESVRESLVRAAALQLGLTVSSCALGAAAWMLTSLARNSFVIYAVLAIVLTAAGVRVLCERPHHCTSQKPAGRAHAGGAFFLGASFALVLSPCCTPMLAGLALFSGSAAYAALLMAAFSVGHGLPLVAAVTGASRLRAAAVPAPLRAAVSCLNGSLLVALGAYYAAIA